MIDPLTLLARGGSVIGDHSPLLQALKRHYADRQIAAGRRTWPSPQVMGWNTWLQDNWHIASAQASDPPLLLNRLAEHAVWQQIIRTHPQSRAEQPLWNLAATAERARGAWQTALLWQVDWKAPGSVDARLFRAWAEQFLKQMQADHRLETARLADYLADHRDNWRPEAPILWYAPDPPAPQARALLDALADDGIPVHIQAPDEAADARTEPQARTYETTDEQWLAAAQWARERLTARPKQHLAILYPASPPPELFRALRETLQPGALLDPDDARLPAPPAALDRVPIIRTALDALRILINPPADPADPVHTRLPDNPYVHINQTPNARQHLDTAPEKARMSQWMIHFNAALKALAWPGDELNAAEQRAMNAFHDLQHDLSGLNLAADMLTATEALEVLTRLAGERGQPAIASESLHISGVCDADGLHFDAVWFGDLSEDNWPPAPAPEPFLPLVAQHKARLPGVDDAAQLARAERLQAALAAHCDELILSYAETADGAPSASSVLFPDRPTRPAPEPVTPYHTQPLLAELERLADWQGLPLPKNNTKARGGSGLVQTQAYCPALAYATYRLGADEPERPVPGLDAAERGSLVHAALAYLWKDLGDSSALGWPAKRLDEAIDAACKTANTEAVREHRLSAAFGALQQNWLRDLIREWLEVEREREQPFRVLHTERRVPLKLGGIELNFTIDRIDELDDTGQLALLDYKTGELPSLAEWFAERLSAPQMPLYALTQNKPVGLLGFAKVRRGDCSVRGITLSAEAQTFSKLVPLEKTKYTDIAERDALLAAWQADLNALMEEFRAGRAGVDPQATGQCRACDFSGVCRIAQR